jgi:hypothetical protein
VWGSAAGFEVSFIGRGGRAGDDRRWWSFNVGRRFRELKSNRFWSENKMVDGELEGEATGY